MSLTDALFLGFQSPAVFGLCIALAGVPIVIWMLIFGTRHYHHWWRVLITFIAGMGSAGLILLYQAYWGHDFNLLFFSVSAQNFDSTLRTGIESAFLTAAAISFSVALLEEWSKHWVVKITGRRIFESVDDVIELSIVAALGFAFLENVGYFFRLIQQGQSEQFLEVYAMRSIFVTFVHVLCSGIYGYFYGLGHFAGPMLKEYRRDNYRPWLVRWLHYLFNFRREIVFRDEMSVLGVIAAAGLHGTYNFLMELDVHINANGIAHTFAGDNSGFALRTLIFPLLLIGGFVVLSGLLEKKEDQKYFGHLVRRDHYQFSPSAKD